MKYRIKSNDNIMKSYHNIRMCQRNIYIYIELTNNNQ